MCSFHTLTHLLLFFGTMKSYLISGDCLTLFSPWNYCKGDHYNKVLFCYFKGILTYFLSQDPNTFRCRMSNYNGVEFFEIFSICNPPLSIILLSLSLCVIHPRFLGLTFSINFLRPKSVLGIKIRMCLLVVHIFNQFMLRNYKFGSLVLAVMGIFYQRSGNFEDLSQFLNNFIVAFLTIFYQFWRSCSVCGDFSNSL